MEEVKIFKIIKYNSDPSRSELPFQIIAHGKTVH